MLISINERGIFNVNVYIEMKTEFKILVYFITFLTPGKRVRTHSQEHPYIFTPSLFCINLDTCMENSGSTVLCPFCAYAAFIHEAPGLTVYIYIGAKLPMVLPHYEKDAKQITSLVSRSSFKHILKRSE